MRKIESLQENEVIVIDNIKQAFKIQQLCEKSKICYNRDWINHIQVYPVYVMFSNKCLWWNYLTVLPDKFTKIPASEFIKKSKTKQRLKALEERMDKLEEAKGVKYCNAIDYEIESMSEEDQSKEIDFSVAGQLVKAIDGDAVFMVTRKSHKEGVFTGVCIKGDHTTQTGETSNNWDIADFKLLTDPITINPHP